MNPLTDHHPLRRAALLSLGCLLSTPTWATAPFNVEASQWGLQLIDAYRAQALGYTGAGQRFGVLDTGVNANHRELQGQVAGAYRAGFGEVNPSRMIDGEGHGTHVTGIIAARKDGLGMHGVAYEAEGVVSDGVALSVEALYEGLSYLVARDDIRFINHSWGFTGAITPNYEGELGRAFLELDFGPLLDLMRASVEKGQVHIFATGNESLAQPVLPAGLPYALPELQANWIAVTALGQEDGLDDTPIWANYCGVTKDWCLAAPGDPILSVGMAQDDYVEMGGTSMAAPHVTGTALLVQQAYPWMTGPQVVQTLLTTATDLGEAGVDEVFGWGLLNAYRAVNGPAQLVADWDIALQGYTSAWRNDIGGRGGLSMQGPGTLVLTGHNTYQGQTQVLGGTLVVNGSLAAPVSVASGAALYGTGRIDADLDVKGILHPGDPVGTLTVNGNVVQAADSSLAPDIAGNAASRLRVIGAGHTYTAAGTLTPGLPTALRTATPAPVLGSGYAIVEAQGGVLGSFTGLAQPGTLAGTRFDTVYETNRIGLYVTPATYANLSAFDTDLNRNQTALGHLLDTRRPQAGVRADTPTQALYDDLAPLDAPALTRAYDQLAGVTVADSLYAALDNVRLLDRRLSAALLAARHGQDNRAATAPDEAGTPTAASTGPTGWTLGFSGTGEQDADRYSAGADTTLSGGLMGLEHRTDDERATGIALGYANRELDFRQAMGGARVESWKLAAYLSRPLASWQVTAQAGLGTAQINGHRALTLAGASHSLETRAFDASAALTASHPLVGPLEGLLGADYAYLHHQGFQERRGDAATRLDVAAGNLQSAGLQAGLAANLPLDRFGLNLSGHARVRQELADVSGQAEATLLGLELDTRGGADERTSLTVGGRLGGLPGQRFAPFLDVEHTRTGQQRTSLASIGLQILW